MILKTLLLISGIWAILLPSILFLVSEKISLIGLYHELETYQKKGEPFLTKFKEISKCNAYLSFPFIFSFFIVIRSTVNKMEVVDTFILSLPITLITLLALRVLSNPSKYFKPNLCHYHRPDKEDEIIDLHKERILSFSYSFICAALVVLLIIWSYNILDDMRLEIIFVPLGSLGFTDFSKLFLLYLFCLGISTLFGEAILKMFPPIKTVPVEKGE